MSSYDINIRIRLVAKNTVKTDDGSEVERIAELVERHADRLDLYASEKEWDKIWANHSTVGVEYTFRPNLYKDSQFSSDAAAERKVKELVESIGNMISRNNRSAIGTVKVSASWSPVQEWRSYTYDESLSVLDRMARL